MEDVTEIILNLKQIRLKRIVDEIDNEKISVKIHNKDVLRQET